MIICPRMNEIVPHTGLHLLLDLHGATKLADVDYIEEICRLAAVATGATVIVSKFHHFGINAGVSGVILLAESHLSIHTWPEFGVATFDVFVCGSCDPELAIPVLTDAFKPTSINKSLHKRGIL